MISDINQLWDTTKLMDHPTLMVHTTLSLSFSQGQMNGFNGGFQASMTLRQTETHLACDVSTSTTYKDLP